MTTNEHTSDQERAGWPFAIACYVGGSALTSATWAIAMNIGVGVQLFVAALTVVALVIAVRLPRRARAMFVAGALTPVALAAAVVAWLIWAFSQSNLTF